MLLHVPYTNSRKALALAIQLPSIHSVAMLPLKLPLRLGFAFFFVNRLSFYECFSSLFFEWSMTMICLIFSTVVVFCEIYCIALIHVIVSFCDQDVTVSAFFLIGYENMEFNAAVEQTISYGQNKSSKELPLYYNIQQIFYFCKVHCIQINKQPTTINSYGSRNSTFQVYGSFGCYLDR